MLFIHWPRPGVKNNFEGRFYVKQTLPNATPSIQQNCLNLWSNASLQFGYPWDLKCPKPVQHCLFYDLKHHLKQFGFSGTVKPGEEEGHLLIQLTTKLFVEPPMALPGYAYYAYLILKYKNINSCFSHCKPEGGGVRACTKISQNTILFREWSKESTSKPPRPNPQ